MAINQLVELAMRVADHERRLSGMFIHGTVAEVDIARKRMRMDLGEATTGGRFLGPWTPYAQWAGALSVHTPPTVGQQFTMMCPTGDLQQAVALPLTWSDQFPSPSDVLEENVLTYGNVRIELRDGQTIMTVGDEATVDVTTDTITVSHSESSVEITEGKIDAKQGDASVTMEGGNIDGKIGGSTLHLDSGNINAKNGASSVDVTGGKIEIQAPVVIIS